MLHRKKIYNPNSNESVNERKIFGGNPTSIFELNKIKYQWAYNLWKVMLANSWFPEEVNMTHFSETEEEHNKHGDINWFNYKNEEYTMSVDFDKEIDANELHKILGIDTSNMPDAYDVQFIKFVQSRKHKKKRINKKWLKRYGYKQISVES